MVRAMIRLLVMLICSLVALPVAALDFDREIQRAEKTINIKYLNPPRSPASFYRLYGECRPLRGLERYRCNHNLASVRYIEYRDQWRAQQKKAEVATGEVSVVLAPKIDRQSASSVESPK